MSVFRLDPNWDGRRPRTSAVGTTYARFGIGAVSATDAEVREVGSGEGREGLQREQPARRPRLAMRPFFSTEASSRYQTLSLKPRNLLPARPASPCGQRNRTHQVLTVHAGLDRKPAIVQGVSGDLEQGRGPPRTDTQLAEPDDVGRFDNSR